MAQIDVPSKALLLMPIYVGIATRIFEDQSAIVKQLYRPIIVKIGAFSPPCPALARKLEGQPLPVLISRYLRAGVMVNGDLNGMRTRTYGGGVGRGS